MRGITVQSRPTAQKLIELANAEQVRYRALVLRSAIPYFLGETDRAIMQAVEKLGEPTSLEIALETGIGETRSDGYAAAAFAGGLVQLGLLREAKRKSDNSMPMRAFAVTDNWLSQEDRQAMKVTEELVMQLRSHLGASR